MRRFSVRAAGLIAAVLTIAGALAEPAAARSSNVPASPGRSGSSQVPGSYVPLAKPSRVVDTRTGAGHNRRGALPARRMFTATIAGRSAVPRRGVGSVLLSVSAVRPTAAGALVVYGGRQPRTTNLQFARGRSVTDTALVALSRGRLHVRNTGRRGRVDVVIDVLGYYRAGRAFASQPGVYHAIRPRRLVDTRRGTGVGRRGALRAHQQITPVLAGPGHGVPAGAGSVAITVTVLGATRPGTIEIGNPGDPGTLAAMHFMPRQAVSSFTAVGLTDESIRLVNASAGRVQVLVDVAGWYSAGIPEVGGALRPLAGARVASTTLAARRGTTVPLAGRAGVPLARVAAVLVTLHAVNPRRSGSLQVWQAGARGVRANTAETFTAHRTSSNTLLVPVSRTGRFAVRNLAKAPTRVVVDVHGYVPANDLPGPGGVGLARYPNDLVDSRSDANYVQDNDTSMYYRGCDAAKSGANFVLLDIGAQSVTRTDSYGSTGLTKDNPGVAITQVGPPTVRLNYPDLVGAIEAYLKGYSASQCNGGTALRLAVGTNNSGSFPHTGNPYPYAAGQRGIDWATHVINPLRHYATAHALDIAVVGAIDIEADANDFDANLKNAENWESAYLANTSAQLIYNGSANGCPTSFGAIAKTCAEGWTERNYYHLAHRGDRIKVLPQIFNRGMAVQWANIDATGDASGRGHLHFLGSLTEYALDSTQLAPPQGRAALYRAVSSVVRTPSVPFAVDINTDS